MPESPDQKNQQARLTTPLGENRLLLSRFECHEGLSEVFEVSIDALSTEEDIDFDAVIGRACSIELDTYKKRSRHFNGILVEAQWDGIREGFYSYRLLLRPWFWLLSHRSDCCFFQDETAPDIIRKVFEKAGFSDHEFKLSNSYPPMEYCVQYRETDFAFVCRLMEEHGIYYFFRHDERRHVMVLADSMSAHEPVPDGQVPFIPLTGAYAREEEHLHQWASERRFRTGRFTLNDYDFKNPTAALEAQEQGSEKYERAALELYDYPGRYEQRDKGETFAKVRLDAEQALDHRRSSTGDAPNIYPGAKMTLSRHGRESENIEYLALRATHVISQQTYRTTGYAGSLATPYQGSYVFASTARPFRAPIVTPKPVIHGIQTAKVVGDSGEEITVDKYGRIKVQFHWDRKKKQSCWIRVAEVWAGKKWGAVFHPRHGQEVVVDFLEGDPDRPLIVGVVYNGDNMPPFDLPGDKTQNGWKSNSTVGGGGYNEFVFEDKKSAETIRMHAQKDHDVVVRNAETWHIGKSFKPPLGSPSRDTTIENGDDRLTIEKGNQNVDIGAAREVTIMQMDTLSVVGPIKTDTQATYSLNALGPITINSMASITLTCGATTVMLTPAGLVVNAPGTIINSSTVINGKSPLPVLAAGKLVIG